jgi:hypothetical protein
MTRAQRDKGARRERQLATLLQDAGLFPDAARCLTETRDGGTGIDLTGTGNLAFQVKSWRAHCPISHLDEVVAPGRIPLLVSWPDRGEPVAVLRLDDLVRILGDVGEVFR